jgi:hypothetical protein
MDDAKNEAIDLVIDILDPRLDELLDVELLSEIPVLGTLTKLARLGLTVRDRLFLSKVSRFLTSLPTAREAEWREFQSKMQADQKFVQRTGEVLVLLLERMNDLEKPQLLAKVFEAYRSGLLTFEEFRRLGEVIDAAYIEDLKRLADRKVVDGTDPVEYLSGLAKVGLVVIAPAVGGYPIVTEQSKEHVMLTGLGTLFVRVLGGKK